MRLVLWSSRSWVFEAGECFLDVVWHGDVDLFVFIVPIDCEANVAAAFPLVADGVVLFDGLHEVFGVFGSNVFHSKIIDDQTEADWSPIVLPKPGADLALPISVCI